MFEQFMALVNGIKLVTLLALILLDTLLGIVLAVKDGKFDWRDVARFLNTSVLSLVGGYFLVGVFALFEPAYRAAVPVTWALIDAKLVADIVAKLKNLGVPLPVISLRRSR